MWRTFVLCAVGVMMVAGCSGGTSDGAGGSGGTLPLAEPLAPTEQTGPANDLAPSQVGASTVPAPPIPGPCDIDWLEFWTAQVVPADATADAVIRIRNAGVVRCEPDISGSPLIDPQIEPDVWLEPGGWADLVVTGEPGCDDAVAVDEVAIDVDGQPVDVGSAVIASCGWELSAFYPNDIAVEACSELDTVVVDGFVLVRNASFLPCVLGDLVEVTGDGVASETATTGPRVEVGDLAGGDVVAFPYRVDGESVCAPGPTAVLTFEGAGSIEVLGVRCGAVHELGPGRPWYGEPDGPLATFRGGDLDVDAALAALDPFDR